MHENKHSYITDYVLQMHKSKHSYITDYVLLQNQADMNGTDVLVGPYPGLPIDRKPPTHLKPRHDCKSFQTACDKSTCFLAKPKTEQMTDYAQE